MMWKSLDNVLLICEISLLLAALVTCSTEAPDYSQVNTGRLVTVSGIWLVMGLFWDFEFTKFIFCYIEL